MSHETFVPVENSPGLCRDPHSKAIVNTDAKALEVAKRAKLERLKKNSEIETLRSDLNTMQREMTELKSLVVEVLTHLKDKS